MKSLFVPTKHKRFIFFLTADTLIILLALVSSFFIRFELSFPNRFEALFLFWLPFIIFIKLSFLFILQLYSITWTFVGIKEMIRTFQATFLASVVLFLLNTIVRVQISDFSLPRSIILLDFILTFILISSFRISKRLYLEVIKEQRLGKRTLIVGAGPTGERLVREFMRSNEGDYYPVALVDDDPTKLKTRIHGVLIAGTLSDILDTVAQYRIQAAIIAITTAKHVKVKEIFESLTAAGVKEIKVVPHISHLPSRSLTVRDIQDIKIEDLLYREPVKVDESAVRRFLQSKTVLVTGGAGSIGSEIVRQALRFHPLRVIAFDIDETEIFNLMIALKQHTDLGTEIIPFIGDIHHDRTLYRCFHKYRPDVVFHAAAYKHVPMMELFPEEALSNNILGTYTLAKKALEFKVRHFVNISTDKAVNPTSIMGATKRMAEMICTTLNKMNGTRFVSVRFGNVLGSRGSVIPIFLEQIKNGGPVTVTHPDVERYFMTIPEAVSLVFQAATMGEGGEVFVLDMGKPVRVLKIAEDLIRLSGMEPHTDIRIDFVGLRPGEKMFEELLTAEEGTNQTGHEKVFIAKNISKFTPEQLDATMGEIKALVKKGDADIRGYLKGHVPFYN